MPGIEHLIQHAVPFALVVFRLAGLFVMAPILASTMIHGRLKVLLAVMLAAALYPTVPLDRFVPVDFDLFTLLPLVVCELLIGMSMGIIASLPMVSLEMSGVIMGQQVGFGLARVYNPELEYEADMLGQILFYLGAGAFLAMGGLETLFAALARTFARVPVGGMGGMTAGELPLELFVGVLASGFEVAMRVAAPVTGIVLLLVIVFGVMSKTMPQLNVMAVGFTAKIMGALALTAFSVYAIHAAASQEIDRVVGLIVSWTESLGT